MTGSIHEIDSSITHYQRSLSILSRSDPRRSKFVLSLALNRLERHILSNQMEDLDKSIVHLTETILLVPRSCPEHGPMILQALFYLAKALVMRSKVSKQPEDAIYATRYLFHLRCQPHEISGVPRHQVTMFLMDALSFQVELEAGNVMQNIRDMAVLCHELLTLDTSDVDTTRLILLILEVMDSKIRGGVPDQPLDELIECLRAARKYGPDLLKGRLALVTCLVNRYVMTTVNDDYEEAMSIVDEINTSDPPGDSEIESIARAQALAIGLAIIRSDEDETPEYLEEAIYRNLSSHGLALVEKHYPIAARLLEVEDIANRRVAYFGSIEGLEASSSKVQLSQLRPAMPKWGQAVDTVESLLLFIQDNEDMTKIDEAIQKGRTLVASYSPTDPFKSHLLKLYSDCLNKAFWRTEKIEYLNELISTQRQDLDYRFGQRFKKILSLAMSVGLRSMVFPGYCTQDADEELELFSQYVNDAHVNVPDRFEVACMWAFNARHIRHPSVSTAYETAVSLMQDNLLFSPTLQLQHVTLATHVGSHDMPLDYASLQFDLGHVEAAIETLERGRTLLWSEMRHFHTSIDKLLETDPDLGHKFAAVNRELEELTKSVPPSHKLNIDDGADDDLRAADKFGRLLLKQRRLLKERRKLISEIQALADFDGFLTSPTFDTLRSVASSGPVIIINHSIWRSDIIILLHNSSPSLISTPPDFHKRALGMESHLLDWRSKYGLDSTEYNEFLAAVLVDLYNIVGELVINRLRQLQIPEQSRIWWCPTSVFCSLPLHAMGPIPSDVGEPRYFLDIYICSYTPSLSALIQSRNRNFGSRSSDRPSILLVAQPDSSLPTVGGEIKVVQALKTEVTSLISEAATSERIIDGFHHHRFVHLACHGTLETGKPFEAGFKLHGDERLTLLEIVRSHVPTAEFAFLSACHTAEVTEGSVSDEGLHLAAAVQYCGFRSVVGTMWAMVDEDGRELAKHFYEALFSNWKRDQRILYPEGTPYHERSAEALRFAVQKLRRRRITLERWVNFVHYGA